MTRFKGGGTPCGYGAFLGSDAGRARQRSQRGDVTPFDGSGASCLAAVPLNGRESRGFSYTSVEPPRSELSSTLQK